MAVEEGAEVLTPKERAHPLPRERYISCRWGSVEFQAAQDKQDKQVKSPEHLHGISSTHL